MPDWKVGLGRVVLGRWYVYVFVLCVLGSMGECVIFDVM